MLTPRNKTYAFRTAFLNEAGFNVMTTIMESQEYLPLAFKQS
jgi:hypothetical protein